MPLKLKVYQTSQGFYDLAIAAPSMKAVLAAWGTASIYFIRALQASQRTRQRSMLQWESLALFCGGLSAPTNRLANIQSRPAPYRSTRRSAKPNSTRARSSRGTPRGG
jgi:hypothetical protein